MSLISRVYNSGFEHDHETRIFKRLEILIENKLRDEDVDSYLLGNVMVNNADIDAIFIRPPSTFFIIEFKQGGGRLDAGENGKWRLNGREMMRDRQIPNPFIQVKTYRSKVNQRLRESSLHNRSRCMVMFSDPVIIPNLESLKNIWFSLFDTEDGANYLLQHNDPKVNFDRLWVNQFLESLGGAGRSISLDSELKDVFVELQLGFRNQLVKMHNGGMNSNPRKAADVFEKLRDESYENRNNRFASLGKQDCEEIKGTFFRNLGFDHQILVIPTPQSEIIFAIGHKDEMRDWVAKRAGLTFLFTKEGRVERTNFSPRPGQEVINQDDSSYLSRITNFDVSTLIGNENEFLLKSLREFGPIDGIDKILGFVSMVPEPESKKLLEDVYILLSQGKTNEAKNRIDCFTGDSLPIDDVLEADDEFLEPEANTDNLLNLFDLSSEEWSKFVDPAKFQEWMLLLHPNQERLVKEDFETPVRLHGVSGSGKTSVLVHRAVHLAKASDEGEKILIITLSDALSDLIQELVERLCDGKIPSNLIIQPYYFFVGRFLDALPDEILIGFCESFEQRLNEGTTLNNRLYELMKDRGSSRLARLLSFSKNSENRQKWEKFFDDQESYDNLDQIVIRDFGEEILSEYVWDELTLVRSVSDISENYSSYLSHRRNSRGIALKEIYRNHALEKLKKWDAEMLREGFLDELTFTQAVNYFTDQQIEIPSEFRFKSILVDEYQDLSTFDIKFLNELVLEKKNGLFLTGDVAQKINAKQFDIMKVVPRELLVDRRLLKNYRNSKQILDMAYSMVEKVLNLDRDHTGSHSDIDKILKPELADKESAMPFLIKCNDPIVAAWKYMQDWKEGGNAPFTTCILTVDPKQISTAEILSRLPSGAEARILDGDYMEHPEKFVVAELEQVKGFEFMQVIILGAENGIFPPQLKDAEIRLEDHERDLFKLYVGITRARDEVRFIYQEEPSPFLSLVKEKMTELEDIIYEEERPPVPVDDFAPDEDDDVEDEDDSTEIELAPDPDENTPGEEPVSSEPNYPGSDMETEEVTTGHMGHYNILEIQHPATVNKIIKALGRDPVTDIDVVHHLESNVANMTFLRPHSTVVANPYVLETLKKWKCTAKFIGGNSRK